MLLFFFNLSLRYQIMQKIYQIIYKKYQIILKDINIFSISKKLIKI